MKTINSNIVLAKTITYFLAKYILFYLFLAIKTNNYFFFKFSNMNEFMYWWLLLALPVFCFLIFCIPIYFILQTESKIIFVVFLFLILISEYLLYTYLASPINLLNGVFNEVFGLLLFCMIFFKQIKHLFGKKLTQSIDT